MFKVPVGDMASKVGEGFRRIERNHGTHSL